MSADWAILGVLVIFGFLAIERLNTIADRLRHLDNVTTNWATPNFGEDI